MVHSLAKQEQQAISSNEQEAGRLARQLRKLKRGHKADIEAAKQQEVASYERWMQFYKEDFDVREARPRWVRQTPSAMLHQHTPG